jgi:hypothetical protein
MQAIVMYGLMVHMILCARYVVSERPPKQRFMIGGLFYLGAPALLLWAHKQQLASQLMDPILLIPVSNWS